MSPASVTKLADYVRRVDVTQADKLTAIAKDVDALEVLARTNAQAQRATGDAVAEIATAAETISATQTEHGGAIADLGATVIRVETKAGEVETIATGGRDLAREALIIAKRTEAKVDGLPKALTPVVDKAEKNGVAKGVGATLASASVILAAGFANDPVGFVEAVTKLLGGG